ncbi:hypothetical protein [Labilibaculum sp.]
MTKATDLIGIKKEGQNNVLENKCSKMVGSAETATIIKVVIRK